MTDSGKRLQGEGMEASEAPRIGGQSKEGSREARSWLVKLCYSSSLRYSYLMKGIGGLPDTETLQTPDISELSDSARSSIAKLDPHMAGFIDLAEVSEPGEDRSREPGHRPGERVARGARRARAAAREASPVEETGGGERLEGAASSGSAGLPRPETFESSRRPETSGDWEELFSEYLNALEEWRLRRRRRAEDIALSDLEIAERHLEDAEPVDRPRSAEIERALKLLPYVGSEMHSRIESAERLWRWRYDRDQQQRLKEAREAERRAEEAEERQEREKRLWAEEYGSSRLNELLVAGYEADLLYVRERAGRELPGFVPLLSDSEGRVPSMHRHPEPSGEALRIASESDNLLQGNEQELRDVSCEIVRCRGEELLPSVEGSRDTSETEESRSPEYSEVEKGAVYELVLIRGFLGSYDLLRVVRTEYRPPVHERGESAPSITESFEPLARGNEGAGGDTQTEEGGPVRRKVGRGGVHPGGSQPFERDNGREGDKGVSDAFNGSAETGDDTRESEAEAQAGDSHSSGSAETGAYPISGQAHDKEEDQQVGGLPALRGSSSVAEREKLPALAGAKAIASQALERGSAAGRAVELPPMPEWVRRAPLVALAALALSAGFAFSAALTLVAALSSGALEAIKAAPGRLREGREETSRSAHRGASAGERRSRSLMDTSRRRFSYAREAIRDRAARRREERAAYRAALTEEEKQDRRQALFLSLTIFSAILLAALLALITVSAGGEDDSAVPAGNSPLEEPAADSPLSREPSGDSPGSFAGDDEGESGEQVGNQQNSGDAGENAGPEEAGDTPAGGESRGTPDESGERPSRGNSGGASGDSSRQRAGGASDGQADPRGSASSNQRGSSGGEDSRGAGSADSRSGNSGRGGE